VKTLDKNGIGGRRAAGMKKPGRQTYRSSPAERAGLGPSPQALAAAKASLQSNDAGGGKQQLQVTFNASANKTVNISAGNTKWAAKKLTDGQRLKRAAQATIKVRRGRGYRIST
jgi:hypothetical protein